MSFGSQMIQVRKEQGMSQDALAQALGATPTTVGRYERDEVKPSIEMAARIAAVLGVSLDFLVGQANHTLKDKSMLERFNSLMDLSPSDRDHIVFALDAMIRDAQARKAYS